VQRASPLMDRSSRLSMPGTRTSPRPGWGGVLSGSMRASPTTSLSLKPPIGTAMPCRRQARSRSSRRDRST